MVADERGHFHLRPRAVEERASGKNQETKRVKKRSSHRRDSAMVSRRKARGEGFLPQRTIAASGAALCAYRIPQQNGSSSSKSNVASAVMKAAPVIVGMI